MTVTTVLDVPPVVVGHAYTIDIEVEDETPFPAGDYAAQVRETIGAAWSVADLTTSGGGLTRISDSTMRLSMTAAQTALIGNTVVVVDFVRTDTDPDTFTYVRVTLPVTQTTTRT